MRSPTCGVRYLDTRRISSTLYLTSSCKLSLRSTSRFFPRYAILIHVRGSTLRRPDAPTPYYVSPVIMPVQPANNVAISPPTTPTSTLPSPIIPHTGFSATTPRRSTSSTSAERPLPPVLEDPQPVFVPSPQLLPRDHSPVLQPTSSISSPARLNPARSSQSTLNIPGLVLPQPALSYRVAEV